MPLRYATAKGSESRALSVHVALVLQHRARVLAAPDKGVCRPAGSSVGMATVSRCNAQWMCVKSAASCAHFFLALSLSVSVCVCVCVCVSVFLSGHLRGCLSV